MLFLFHSFSTSFHIFWQLFSLYSIIICSIVSIFLHWHIALSCHFGIFVNHFPTLCLLCVGFYIKFCILNSIILLVVPFYISFFVILLFVFFLSLVYISFIFSSVGLPLGYTFFSFSISTYIVFWVIFLSSASSILYFIEISLILISFLVLLFFVFSFVLCLLVLLCLFCLLVVLIIFLLHVVLFSIQYFSIGLCCLFLDSLVVPNLSFYYVYLLLILLGL